MPESQQENLGSGLTRSFRGYAPKAVDRIVRDLTARCEALERERDDLRQQLEASKAETVETRDLERTLRDTLVLAQRSADELKEQSRLEAEATLDDARGEARDIVGEADRRADLLRAELKLLEERERETRQRFSDMLRDTLAQLEGSRGEALGTGSLVDDLRPSADRVN
jgi:cell division initiation protein